MFLYNGKRSIRLSNFFRALRWPGGYHNLDIIAACCGYDSNNHHHALADAEACARIAMEIL